MDQFTRGFLEAAFAIGTDDDALAPNPLCKASGLVVLQWHFGLPLPHETSGVTRLVRRQLKAAGQARNERDGQPDVVRPQECRSR